MEAFWRRLVTDYEISGASVVAPKAPWWYKEDFKAWIVSSLAGINKHIAASLPFVESMLRGDGRAYVERSNNNVQDNAASAWCDGEQIAESRANPEDYRAETYQQLIRWHKDLSRAENQIMGWSQKKKEL